MLTPITITCVSLGRSLYSGVVAGRVVTKRTKTPFYSTARALLKEGVPPETLLQMHHQGSTTVAVRSTVGEAAKWAVDEPADGSPRIVRHKPYPADR